MGRNLMNEPRPVTPYQVEEPTESESLGYRRGRLARMMMDAGEFDSKASMRLMTMDLPAVERQIEYYQKKKESKQAA